MRLIESELIKMKTILLPYLFSCLVIVINCIVSDFVAGSTSGSTSGSESTYQIENHDSTLTILEPCAFNRLCTCRSERLIATYHDQQRINQLNRTHVPEVSIQSDESAVRLIETSCVQIPFAVPPPLPVNYLNALQLVGCSYLHQLTAHSFANTSIAALTVSRSSVHQLHGNSLTASRHTLTALDLSHNHLHSLPVSALRPLTALQWLNVRGNRIQQLNVNLLSNSIVSSLRTLLASENQISRLNSLGSLIFLQSLDLDHNQLRSVEGRALPVTLHTLSLANNLLSEWPTAALNPLNQLRWLQLRGNHIKTLPNHWPLTSYTLDLLDLSHNLLSSIATGTFKRSHVINAHSDYRRTADSVTLYTVDNGNSLSTPTSKFRINSVHADMQSDLAHRPLDNVTHVPEAHRIQIKNLHLDHNLIRQIDASALHTVLVERIGLSNNLLDDLPANVFSSLPATSVQYLDISSNQFKTICSFVQPLKHLQHLQCRSNQITSLANECFQNSASYLAIVDLSANPLHQVPTSALQSLLKLRRLALEQTELTQLTGSSFQGTWCKHLTHLSLSHNHIRSLPRDTFKSCVSLKELRLTGNPLWSTSGTESKETLAGLVAIGKRLNTLQLGNIHSLPSLQSRSTFKCDHNTLLQSKFNCQTEPQIHSDLIDTLQSLKGLELLELNHNALQTINWTQLNTFGMLKHLDLEGNRLSVIPKPESGRNVSSNLHNLVLTDNAIVQVHSGCFDSLAHLSLLVLIDNRIESIQSKAFHRLPALTNLMLAHNHIQHVQTGAFSKLNTLRWLQMQFNQLKRFSLAWFNITDLLIQDKAAMMNDEHAHANADQSPLFLIHSHSHAQHNVNTLNQGLHLNLSFNQIAELDSGESVLRSMQNKWTSNASNVSNISLNAVESDLEIKLNVLSLDLSHNQIQHLPPNFTKAICWNLIKLNLAFNRFNQFPVWSLSFCPHLQILSLKDNQIDRPSTVSSQQLIQFDLPVQELDLSHNAIRSLIDFQTIFDQMKKLRILNLSHNQIQVTSSNVFAHNPLQVLDLSHNQLNQDQFDTLLGTHCLNRNSSLKILLIQHNPIKQLPNNLNKCDQLTYLSAKDAQLSDTNFKSLHLINLIQLDLSNNHFDTLEPFMFQHLINLETLKLSHCAIKSISEIPLPNLLHLHLRNNSIASISGRDLSQLSQLRTLILANNQLTDVPKSQWKFLNELNELDLSGNPIESLDSNSLSDLKQLKTVDIRNLNLKYVDSRVFHAHSHLTYIKTSTYPLVRSFRLYDLLAKMDSLQKAWIEVQEQVLFHQIQWAFGSKLKELTLSGKSLNTILPDAFLGLYHTSDFTLRITDTNISRLPDGLLRYFAETWHVTLDLRHNRLQRLDESVFNVTLKERHVQKQMNPLQPTGGLMVEDNQLVCSCHLVWLRNWLRRWLRDTRRSLLFNPEVYIRHIQMARSLKCRLSNQSAIDTFQSLADPSARSPHVRQISVLTLDELELGCQSSAALVSASVPALLLFTFILILWIIV